MAMPVLVDTAFTRSMTLLRLLTRRDIVTIVLRASESESDDAGADGRTH
jgi:hypothetical protein